MMMPLRWVRFTLAGLCGHKSPNYRVRPLYSVHTLAAATNTCEVSSPSSCAQLARTRTKTLMPSTLCLVFPLRWPIAPPKAHPQRTGSSRPRTREERGKSCETENSAAKYSSLSELRTLFFNGTDGPGNTQSAKRQHNPTSHPLTRAEQTGHRHIVVVRSPSNMDMNNDGERGSCGGGLSFWSMQICNTSHRKAASSMWDAGRLSARRLSSSIPSHLCSTSRVADYPSWYAGRARTRSHTKDFCWLGYGCQAAEFHQRPKATATPMW